MKKIFRHIINMTACMLTLCATSCDVHEFPEPITADTEAKLHLHMSLDSTSTIYKEINYALDDNGKLKGRSSDDMMIHYRVQGYRNLAARGATRDASTETPDFTADVYGNSPQAPDTVLHIPELAEGEWYFITWADVCDNNGKSLSHNADDFGNITLVTNNGCIQNSQNAYAWRGEISASVDASRGQHLFLAMEQPQGKFRFITTDLAKFIDEEVRSSRYVTSNATTQNRTIDMTAYKIMFYVDGFYPTVFDNFANKPVDAATGHYGYSTFSDVTDTTANLGGLHVMVNGAETSLRIIAQVIYRDNTVVCQTDPVTVPVVRGKTTVVKGPFLTARTSGGLGINPEFDGDFNLFIR